MPNHNQNLTENLMDKIQSGKIKPVPGYVFAIKAAMTLGIVIISVVFGIISTNFIFHGLRTKQPFQYLMFDEAGPGHFIEKFPLVYVLLGLFVLLLFIAIIKEFPIFYKSNRVGLLVLSSVIIIMLGFIIDIVGVNEILEDKQILNNVIYGNESSNEVLVSGFMRVDKNQNIYLSTPTVTYLIDSSEFKKPQELSSLVNSCVTAHGTISNNTLLLELIRKSNHCE